MLIPIILYLSRLSSLIEGVLSMCQCGWPSFHALDERLLCDTFAAESNTAGLLRISIRIVTDLAERFELFILGDGEQK